MNPSAGAQSARARRSFPSRALTMVVGLGALSISLAACGSGSGLGAGEGRLEPVGAVELRAPGHRPVRVRQPRVLRRGDRVDVLAGGSARVEFAHGDRVEMRSGTAVELGDLPELLSGDLLVIGASKPLVVRASGTDVSVVAGVAHLSDDGGSVLAACYQGRLEIDSLGRHLTVPALRQTSVPVPGFLGTRPVPLDYREDAPDPWDRRFLGPAIALGEDLVARSNAFTQDLPSDAGRTPGFFRAVLPGLTDPSFVGLFDAASPRPVGETLVGTAIALESRRGTFPDRWKAVFSFRDDGAKWGLVALDQAVAEAPLLAGVDRALALARPPIAQTAAPLKLAAPPTSARAPAPTVSPPPPVPTTTTVAPARRPAPSTT
ncbi:MAG: hypothetical protein ACYDAD_02100, partial [Acidimicrobiales bacterium]